MHKQDAGTERPTRCRARGPAGAPESEQANGIRRSVRSPARDPAGASEQAKGPRRPHEPPVPRLHVIADDDVVAAKGAADQLLELAEACGSAVAIQLRARASAAKRIHDLAFRLAEEARARRARVLVSDRLDVAVAAGAHGVHLREDSMPVADAKALIGILGRSDGGARTEQAGPGRPDRRPGRVFFVGRSIHSPRQASEPWSAAADYLVFGAVWPTPSHPGRAATGRKALERAVEHAPVPVLAIGGATPERAAAARSSGAWGVAVRSGVWSARNPSQAAIRYLEALGVA